MVGNFCQKLKIVLCELWCYMWILKLLWYTLFVLNQINIFTFWIFYLFSHYFSSTLDISTTKIRSNLWRDCSPILNIQHFFVSQQEKHFSWKVHLNKATLTQNNRENRVLKVSPTEYCYIYNTDWLWAPFFSIISC